MQFMKSLFKFHDLFIYIRHYYSNIYESFTPLYVILMYNIISIKEYYSNFSIIILNTALRMSCVSEYMTGSVHHIAFCIYQKFDYAVKH